MTTLPIKPARKLLSLRNEAAARRLGWRSELQITWREFLEQYPYQGTEAAAPSDQAQRSAA